MLSAYYHDPHDPSVVRYPFSQTARMVWKDAGPVFRDDLFGRSRSRAHLFEGFAILVDGTCIIPQCASAHMWGLAVPDPEKPGKWVWWDDPVQHLKIHSARRCAKLYPDGCWSGDARAGQPVDCSRWIDGHDFPKVLSSSYKEVMWKGWKEFPDSTYGTLRCLPDFPYPGWDEPCFAWEGDRGVVAAKGTKRLKIAGIRDILEKEGYSVIAASCE